MKVNRDELLLRIEAAALVFFMAIALISCAGDRETASPAMPQLVAVDGDTLRAGPERLRLVGIDAPELHGCRRGRVCVSGDPVRARATLAALLQGRVDILRLGFDRYGRTIAAVRVNGDDLSCAQLRAGSAEYKVKWDNGRTVHGRCANLAP